MVIAVPPGVPPVPPPGHHYWHVIEAGLGTAPPADPAAWTRLSGVDLNPVRSVETTSTCKNRSDGRPEPGGAAFTLTSNGADRTSVGWLDPSNPTGPYTGRLVAGVPIRSRLTDGVSFWPEWRGFVKSWPASQGIKQLEATIEAYDALGWLDMPAPHPNDLQRAVMATRPSSYWPHDDSSGQILIADIAAGINAATQGPAALGGPSLTVEGDGGSATFTNQPSAFVQTSALAMPRPPFTVAMMVRVFTAAVGAPGVAPDYFSTGLVAGNAAGVFITPYYAAVWDGVAAAPIVSFWGTGGAPLTAGLYMLIVRYDLNGRLTTTLGSGPGVPSRVTFGAYQNPAAYTALKWGAAIGIAAPGDTGNGNQIGHVAFWPRILGAGEETSILSAAFLARTGETVDQRVGYFLDLVGWPAGLRRLGACTSTVGPVRMRGLTVLDCIRDAVQYEDGVLAASSDGYVTLTGRQGDPAPTFALGGIAAPKEEASYLTSEVGAVTTAAVSDPAVVFTDTGGLVAGRSVQVPQLAATPDDAWLTAQRIVQLGGAQHAPSVDSVTFDPVLVPAAITLDQGATGTVARRPIWSASDIVEKYQVSAIRSTGGAGQRALRTVSFVPARRTQWRLRVPPGLPATGASSPWRAAFDAVSVTAVVQFRLDDWGATGIVETMLSHATAALALGWMFQFAANLSPPRLLFTWADNGGAIHTATSDPVVRSGARFLWAAVSLFPAGSVQFAISTGNRYQLQPWGIVNLGGATTVRATATGPLEVGVEAGTNNPLAGDVLRAHLFTNAGAPVASFDPTADNQAGAATWTAPTGETWTVNGTSTLIAG